MYDTSGQFLSGSTREFVISNGYGKLRLYDVCASVKPVIDHQVCDYLLSKAVPTECGKYVIYASQKGDLAKCDLRMNFRMVHKFKGAKGSIRDIAVQANYVACIGLDRYLRVYHHETKETLANVYLRQKLNTVLIDSSTVEDYTSAYLELKKELQEKEEKDHEEFCNSTFKTRGKRRRQPGESAGKQKHFKFEE